jgi:hypothetical protein
LEAKRQADEKWDFGVRGDTIPEDILKQEEAEAREQEQEMKRKHKEAI